jgi:16S rRNA (cytidine1402-2'-O)-methyltransferase
MLSVPGSDDLVTGLILSGLPSDRFAFLGDLAASSSGGRDLLRRAVDEQHTIVGRVRGTGLGEALRAVRELLGDRQIAIYGGMEIWRGLPADALARPGAGLPGEAQDAWLYLYIAGASGERTWHEARVRDEVRSVLEDGTSARDAARIVAERSGWRRKAVYGIVLEVGGRRGER